jgi:hypothetical protein
MQVRGPPDRDESDRWRYKPAVGRETRPRGQSGRGGAAYSMHTAAVPFSPMALAAAMPRSMSMRRVEGPRSLTTTMTDSPVFGIRYRQAGAGRQRAMGGRHAVGMSGVAPGLPSAGKQAKEA